MARYSSYLQDWQQQMGLAWPRRYSKALLQASYGTPGNVNNRPWGHGPLVPPNVSAQNQVNQYGPFPSLYGTYQYFPPYVGQPYTEYDGQDCYTRVLYLMGYGPLQMTEFWIGNQLLVPEGLSDTTVGYDASRDVQIEVRYGYNTDTPMTLFPHTVVEDTNVISGLTNVFVFKETPIECTEASVGILFTNGLYQGTATSPQTYYAAFEIDYAPTDGSGNTTGPWVGTAGIQASCSSAVPVQEGLNIKFPSRGLYIVRLKRTVGAAGSGSNITDASQWSYLAAIDTTSPWPPVYNVDGTSIPLARVAIRAKVQNSTQRAFDNFSVVGQRLLKCWTGSAWTLETTNNPAWAYVDAYSNQMNKKAIPLSQFNTTQLLAWAQNCDNLGLEYNNCIDTQQTAFQTAQDICTAGRANPVQQNGLYSVVFDQVQTTPSQLFTPRNARAISFQKNFVKLPEALRVQWTNPLIDYQQDEVLVFAPGYNGDGSGGLTQATNFQTYQLTGVTSPQQAYILASYYLAVGVYRQRIVTFDTDVEFLPCNVGDLINVTSEVLGMGTMISGVLTNIGQGYIQSLTYDGSGDVTGFTIDDTITGDGTTVLSATIRLSNNTYVTGALTTFSGAHSSFTFAAPIPVSSPTLPVVGNLVAIGAPPCQQMIITKIQPKQSPQLTATITCVDYNPAIFGADTNSEAMANWLSQQTINPIAQNRDTPEPQVITISSGTGAMVPDSTNTPQPRILITLTAGDHTVAQYAGYYTPTGSNAAPIAIAPVAATLGQISIQPVKVGQAYDISLYSISATGVPSQDVLISGYVVLGDTEGPTSTLTANETNGILSWVDPDPASDLAGYLVKVINGSTPNWAGGSLLTPTPLTGANQLDVSSSLNGTVTLMVAAVDTSGNVGAVAYVTTNLGDPIVDNVVVTYDFVVNNFPGAIVNGTVSGGALKANSESVFWSSDPEAVFWNSVGSTLFWTANFDQMTYTCGFTVASNELPASLTLPNTVTGGGYTITYSIVSFNTPFWNTNGSSLFWPSVPVVSNQAWPAQGVAAQAGNYQFTVTTNSGDQQGQITRLQAVLDVVDVVETFTSITISAGGTRLNLTETFRVITAVGLTLCGSGAGGLTASVLDRQATLGAGPLIEVFNSSGTSVGGTVDATVEGY